MKWVFIIGGTALVILAFFFVRRKEETTTQTDNGETRSLKLSNRPPSIPDKSGTPADLAGDAQSITNALGNIATAANGIKQLFPAGVQVIEDVAGPIADFAISGGEEVTEKIIEVAAGTSSIVAGAAAPVTAVAASAPTAGGAAGAGAAGAGAVETAAAGEVSTTAAVAVTLAEILAVASPFIMIGLAIADPGEQPIFPPPGAGDTLFPSVNGEWVTLDSGQKIQQTGPRKTKIATEYSQNDGEVNIAYR